MLARGCQVRKLTTAASTSASSQPSGRPRIARLPHKHILEVSGPDTAKFLNGQTCKNTEALGGGYSGFLNATGRVLHTCFIFPRTPTSYLISHESPASHPAPLASLLPPYRLRSKVKIKDVTDEWDAWAAWDSMLPAAAQSSKRLWKFGSGGAAESQWSWPNGVGDLGLAEGEVGTWDLRAGVGMKQILVPKGRSVSLLDTHEEVSAEDYRLHRMLKGLPEGPDEVTPGAALPLESSMDVHGGVDFRKGCYLGQELTVRTYHTGATRKRILPIRIFPLDNASAAQPLSAYIDEVQPGPFEGAVDTSLVSASSSNPVDIIFHPAASSATQRPKTAGRLLSLHPGVASVGLGLVRIEYADKAWWSHPGSSNGSVSDWLTNGEARLTATIGGQQCGVYVGRGEAYGAALTELRDTASED